MVNTTNSQNGKKDWPTSSCRMDVTEGARICFWSMKGKGKSRKGEFFLKKRSFREHQLLCFVLIFFIFFSCNFFFHSIKNNKNKNFHRHATFNEERKNRGFEMGATHE